MTIRFWLYGNSGTLELNSGAIVLAANGYTPKTGDGDTITESANVIISGATFAAIAETVRKIGQFMDAAALWQKNKDRNRYYVGFTPVTGTITEYLSELVAGRVVLDNSSLITSANGLKANAQIVFVRRNWWEENTAIGNPLMLSKTGGASWSGSASGSVVMNNYYVEASRSTSGSKNYAYADFGIGIMSGSYFDTPAPVAISLSAPSSGSPARYFISLQNPANESSAYPYHWLTAVSGSATIPASGSVVVDTTASSGSYIAQPLSSTDLAMVTASIGINTTNQFGGQFASLIMRTVGVVGTGVWVKPSLLNANMTIWEGDWSLLQAGHELHEIGIVQLPPGLYATFGSLQLKLTGKNTSGSARQLNMDYIQMTPLSGYRKLVMVPSGSALSGDNVIDDSHMGYTAVLNGAAYRVNFVAYGEPIMLSPSRLNIFTVLCELSDGTAPIDLTHTFQVNYWPRKLVL